MIIEGCFGKWIWCSYGVYKCNLNPTKQKAGLISYSYRGIISLRQCGRRNVEQHIFELDLLIKTQKWFKLFPVKFFKEEQFYYFFRVLMLKVCTILFVAIISSLENIKIPLFQSANKLTIFGYSFM